jgi:hypothetical protein
LLNYVNAADQNANFFLKNGNINKGLGIEYLKVNEWELKPKRKGPVPEDCNYELPKETETHRREIFSIDGECYPTQDVKAKVI